MTSLTNDLKDIADRGAYPDLGRPDVRWGQVLREEPGLGDFLRRARQDRLLVPLREVARIKSGVVPRANAFFLVRELPYEEVPERFNLTRGDYGRVAVVEDGLKTRHRIERTCLRATIKGPEALLGPSSIAETDELLFDCQDRSKELLRNLPANGALTYLRRGETVDYRVSDDALKRGVPAERAQVKNRRPYWYSLHSPKTGTNRLAVPEHFDKRFVASIVPVDDDAVVIDTLYSVEPYPGVNSDLLLASLNSIATWYQLELRGRTQHGEGVLKVKIADWAGVLVMNQEKIGAGSQKQVLQAFKPVRRRDTLSVVDEVRDPHRIIFDQTYLNAAGASVPADLRVDLERELRAAMSERQERARSVHDAKALKAKVTKVTASVDAYATRIAATLEPHPDPRSYSRDDGDSTLVLVASPWEGPLRIGEDLLTQGQVLAGDEPIAEAGDMESAQFVRAVLLHDPDLTSVAVPQGAAFQGVMSRWSEETAAWREQFDAAVSKTTATVNDDRLKRQIRSRALELLHAK